ncbi:MAG: hypothetical protein N5P05_002711 [Chroococcopsis gigantea SAG 12.99]|jgi:hypothetical protein|nr:hypothetical protein [Chroococcopsis gigantea SAG 12.99]
MGMQRRYIIIYDRATGSPFRTLLSLILFSAFFMIPLSSAFRVSQTPERTMKSGYSSLDGKHSGPAIEEFEKAESMPGVTDRQRAKIHLGKAIANQRDLEMIHFARPLLLEQSITKAQTTKELENNERKVSKMIAGDMNKALTYSQKAGLKECSGAITTIKRSLGNTEKDTWQEWLKLSKPCRDS